MEPNNMLLAGLALLSAGIALTAAVLVLLEPNDEDTLYVVPGKQTELEALMADVPRDEFAAPAASVPVLSADADGSVQPQRHDLSVGG